MALHDGYADISRDAVVTLLRRAAQQPKTPSKRASVSSVAHGRRAVTAAALVPSSQNSVSAVRSLWRRGRKSGARAFSLSSFVSRALLLPHTGRPPGYTVLFEIHGKDDQFPHWHCSGVAHDGQDLCVVGWELVSCSDPFTASSFSGTLPCLA